MDVRSIANLMGHPAEAAEMRDMLLRLGIADPPALNEGDTDAYVELKDRGLYLVFTDEVFFKKIEGASIGSNALILTNITAYLKPISEYDAYKGALPFGLLASDNPDAVRSKMGEADLFDEDLNLERWTVEGTWVFVRYGDDMASIDELSLQAPDA
jgi:hypothetical protein